MIQNITNKVKKYFYKYVSKKKNELKLVNLVTNKELIVYESAKKIPKTYYLIDEDNKLMTHSEKAQLIKKYKLEQAFLKYVGHEEYNIIDNSLADVIYSYIDVVDITYLDELNLSKDHKDKLFNFILNYQEEQKNKKEKRVITLTCCSKSPDIIEVLNKIAAIKPIIKENNKYLLHCDNMTLLEKDKLKQTINKLLLEDKSINQLTDYKLT